MKLFLILLFTVSILNTCFSQTEPELVTKLYKNGKKQSEGKIFGGNEYGKWQYWDKKGNLIQETEFSKGMLNGVLIYYYKNGKKQNEGNFYFGIQTKEYKAWYENGNLKEEGRYKAGYKDSIWTYYFENSKKKKIEEYNYETGSLKLIDYWSSKGKQTVKNGNGKYLDYYSTGKIKEEGEYKDGIENGKWILYYKNGQKCRKVNTKMVRK